MLQGKSACSVMVSVEEWAIMYFCRKSLALIQVEDDYLSAQMPAELGFLMGAPLSYVASYFQIHMGP